MKLYHGTTKDFTKPKLNGFGVLWLTENPKVAAQYGNKSYVKSPIAYVWEIELKPTAKIPRLRDLSNRAIRAAFDAQNEANQSGLGPWTERDWEEHADFGVLERWSWMVGFLKKKGLDGVIVQDSIGSIDIPHASVALFKLSAVEHMQRLEVDRSGIPEIIGDIQRETGAWDGDRLSPNARAMKPYNLHGIAGLAERTKILDTGCTMSVYVAKQAGIDAEDPWVTVCETHGSMVSARTRAQARERAENPDWCEQCAEVLEGTMQPNATKIPAGIVQTDAPENETSTWLRDLGGSGTGYASWTWLKKRFGKPVDDYFKGHRLYIEVRPFDANSQWIRDLEQQFTPDSAREATKYGFDLMRDEPHVQGFWVEVYLDRYWNERGQRRTQPMLSLGRYERAPLTPNQSADYPVWASATERQVIDFFRSVSSASAADALRAVPGAKRRDVDRLHTQRVLVSAPSSGRSNMLRIAEHKSNHSAVYNLSQLDDDIDAALDHMSDFDVDLNKSNITVTDPMMIPMRDLGEYDDLSSWLELDSAADAGEVRSFRGAGWAKRAERWTSPQQMPPIVIVEAPSAVAIADGRGRVNYATAMGWDEIPAVIVTPAHVPNHSANYYVWLIDHRNVPLTEGPYGPMSLASASSNARIGAKEGDHDRVVSEGRDPEAESFEIVRRYRRGTGERML